MEALSHAIQAGWSGRVEARCTPVGRAKNGEITPRQTKTRVKQSKDLQRSLGKCALEKLKNTA